MLAALFAGAAVVLFALSALAVAALNLPIVAAFDVLAIHSPKISTQTIYLNYDVVTYTPSPTTDPPPTLAATLAPARTPPPLPTATLASTSAAPPTPDLSGRTFVIGQSVEGRDITGIAFPASGDPAQALVLVSGIHGDEMNAWPVLQSLISNLDDGTFTLPAALGIYFVESLNPDGAAADRRLNANHIDLNRNWETYDWRTGIEVSSTDFLPRGGGPAPFSEPETRAMRDWLIGLQAQYPGGVTVIYFHAAFPPTGLVTPGTHFVNGEDLGDTPSRRLGVVLAGAADYQYDNRWPGGYRVTGDASTWAVAQGMRSLTVELPMRGTLEDEDAAQLREALITMIHWMVDR